jgi:hypothetical protein
MDQDHANNALQQITAELERILESSDLGYDRVVLIMKQVGMSEETSIDLYTLDGETMGVSGDLIKDATTGLRAAYYTPGTGSWFIANITLHRGGRVETDFDYDADPRATEPRMAVPFPDALLQEIKLYPRDPGNWPGWFMEKATEFGVYAATTAQLP